jgi:hypothetical protein
MKLCRLALAWLLILFAPAMAHEGHDHDKPAPLNLPVAPRVIAVTPDLELVGVSSGKDRLTIFLHTFATNEPVKGARMTVSAGGDSAEAKSEGDGVFTLVVPWMATTADTADLVFALKLADGSEDLLTGRLQQLSSAGARAGAAAVTQGVLARLKERPDLPVALLVGAMAGCLMTLLVVGMGSRRRVKSIEASGPQEAPAETRAPASTAPVKALRRTAGALLCVAVLPALADRAQSQEAKRAELPSVPSTMATDLAQRMPDGTLFVPKATQHLLSIRTMLSAEASAPLAVELAGTVTAGPGRFGRVQPGRPGRIDAPAEGLAYIGKRVQKGELLAYVETYIAAADRANLESSIAETEARIEKNRTILSRYEKSSGAVPQVKIDEVRGELEALIRKRAELVPSVGSREPVLAPISGVVSVANATAGQIVEARDVLFEIVDPSEFWIEAHGHGHEAKLLKDIAASFAIVGGARQIPVQFVGRGLALRNQATVLTFKIAARDDGLSVGMPVKVVVQSEAKVDGFVVPASAIVRGPTGLPIAWVKTEPERFEPRTVKAEPLDGRSVVVTAGLKPDMRIVTDGVTLLNQVR